MNDLASMAGIGLPTGAVGNVGLYALLTLLATALVKTWPILTKLSFEAKASARAEKREDERTCQERIDALERRLDASDARAQLLQTQVTLLGAAYSVVVTELHRKDPRSHAITLAQNLLAGLAPALPEDHPEHMQ